MSAIRPVDLARHWGTGRGYVSNLRKDGMPEFESFEAADAWRAEHAPARARRNASRSATSTEAGTPPEPPFENNNNPRQGRVVAPVEPVDVAAFIAAAGTDFDSLMIRQAEATVQVAHGLYLKACERQDPIAIAQALRNWNEAAEVVARRRADFLGLQEKARSLLPIDKAKDIVGRQLQALRLALLRAGDRCAADANPSDPARAKRIIDAEVDRILARAADAESTISGELAAA